MSVDLAIPMIGYKNYVGIERAHGLIRTWETSAANAHDGTRLPNLVSCENTASGVWADTAYRSKKVSHSHPGTISEMNRFDNAARTPDNR